MPQVSGKIFSTLQQKIFVGQILHEQATMNKLITGVNLSICVYTNSLQTNVSKQNQKNNRYSSIIIQDKVSIQKTKLKYKFRFFSACERISSTLNHWTKPATSCVTYVWRRAPGVSAPGWQPHQPSCRTWPPVFCFDTPTLDWSREPCDIPPRPSSEWMHTCTTSRRTTTSLVDIRRTLIIGLFSRTTWVSRHQKGKLFWT